MSQAPPPPLAPQLAPDGPTLRDLPPELRPRERLMSEGAARLEPEALVALILSTGRGPSEDALQLARSALSALGGLRRLSEASAQVLCEVKGLGPVKAARLVAAFELARRAQGAAALGEGAPPAPPLTAMERLARAARAAWVDETSTLVACRGEGALDEALTLALDQELDAACGDAALVGRWLRRLLLEGEGDWTLIACRRGELREGEERAAERLFEGAALLGVRVSRLLVVSERLHHELTPRSAQRGEGR